MNNNPSPNTRIEPIKKLSNKYLTEIEPDEKKRYLNAWCEILKYGIERHSQNGKRWQPPNEAYIKELIGKSTRTKQDKLTPYIEEHDLLRLLDNLESRDFSLFLAVGLELNITTVLNDKEVIQRNKPVADAIAAMGYFD